MLWTFYSMQGSIIKTGGSTFSQLLVLFLIAMGLYYTFKTLLLPNKPVFFFGLNLLFAMFAVYGTILLFSDHHYIIQAKLYDNEVSNTSYLKNIFMSLPNIYAFYYFTYKGFLSVESLKKWAYVFFCVAIFRFFDFQIGALQAAAILGNDATEVTNNMGYLFAALIPYVVLFENNLKKQYGLIIVCLIFLFWGMKRGAILVGILSLIYFMYFNYKFQGNISKLKIVLSTVILIAIGTIFFNYMMTSSDFFLMRYNATLEGGTNGRDYLFTTFYNHFIHESDSFKLFLGNGANATLEIGTNFAHNDWLEIAINQGILGLIVYAMYWFGFMQVISDSQHNHQAKLVFVLTFIGFFTKTFFSMSYTDYSITVSSIFAFYLANYNNQIEIMLFDENFETNDFIVSH